MFGLGAAGTVVVTSSFATTRANVGNVVVGCCEDSDVKGVFFCTDPWSVFFLGTTREVGWSGSGVGFSVSGWSCAIALPQKIMKQAM